MISSGPGGSAGKGVRPITKFETVGKFLVKSPFSNGNNGLSSRASRHPD